MSTKRLHRKRKNGIFYTPWPAAVLLAREAVGKRDLLILDPACGEGTLLRAAAEEIRRFRGSHRPHLVGCDRFKPQKLDRRIEFVRCDFFAYKSHEKFDVILTNPPYLQSARINVKDRERYRTRYAKPLGFSSNVDLWVYFLVKSTMHLRRGGTIAAVLPWSFLEAEYAQSVRKWITENFRRVRVLVLEGAHFEDTVKRVLLVWFEGYGSRAQCVQIGCADECASHPDFQDLSLEMWNSENVMAGLNPKANDIAQRLREAGFRPLEEYADVAIGIVTGANDYFILSCRQAEELGFSRRSVLPVLTSVQDLGKVAGQESPGKVLLQFKRMTNKRKKYVSEGVKSRLHERIHCQRREKQKGAWYDVDPGLVPGAFFTYRVSNLPYLILNTNGYQCTNALHKVFFDDVSRTEQKWIQLSLLSLFGQLSLEIGARHYGNGIMKIEPKILKRALVYRGRTRIPKGMYESILQDVAAGRKEKACTKTTQLVVSEADIDESLVTDALAALNEIRNRRGAPLIPATLSLRVGH